MSGEVAVLGGGNTAFSVAAKLALEGYDVALWEHPSQASSIASIVERREIRLTGTGGSGVAHLAVVTTDPSTALAFADVLIAPVPSYAHAPLVEAIGAHLEPRHLLALTPGNLGTLTFAEALGRARPGAAMPLLVETDTAPYVCRKLGLDHAHIWGVVPAMGAGTYPASRTDEAISRLGAIFPGIVGNAHVLETALNATNPIMHPLGVLLNAGRIERSQGDFYFYEEGVTPAVSRVIEALDAERRAVGRAVGLDLPDVAALYHHAGFGPRGDLWEVINGSRMLTPLRAPGSLDTRWLSEDTPYALATWVELGHSLGVPMPVAAAAVTLATTLMGGAPHGRRTLADIGLAGLDADGLLARLA
jgi:opine dehydrogenase